MPNRAVDVGWEVAADQRFRARRAPGRRRSAGRRAGAQRPRRAGRAAARAASTSTASAPSGHSPRSAAPAPPRAPRRMAAALAMAFASCSQYEHGYFTAYRRLAEDQPDLVLHLGDYQYEYAPDDYIAPGGNPRDHAGPGDRDAGQLPAAARAVQDRPRPAGRPRGRAVAGGLRRPRGGQQLGRRGPEHPETPQPNFLARRAAAFHAYYENMPLRRTSVPRGIDMQLYRRVRWGRLATFHMLDTRQYRDDQACGDGYQDCPARADPRRSHHRRRAGAVAARRLPPLRRPLGRARPAGVLRPARPRPPARRRVTSMDAWDGYAGLPRPGHPRLGRRRGPQPGGAHRRRARPLGQRPQAGLRRPDVAHGRRRAGLLARSPRAATAPTPTRPHHRGPAVNPHLRFYNNQRGYVRTTITPRQHHAPTSGSCRTSPARRAGVHPGHVRRRGPGTGPAPDLRPPARRVSPDGG